MTDGRNGGRRSYHPEDPQVSDDFDSRATASIAAQAARRQALADKDIDKLLDDVDRIERGDTEWQQHVKANLQAIFDAIAEGREEQQAVMTEVVSLQDTVFHSKFVWPGLAFTAIVFIAASLTTVAIYLVVIK